MSLSKIFRNGLIDENPTFRMVLGMCPTLAVTTLAGNGLGMGIATTFVMALSNLFISLLRKSTPERIRIPVFVVIITASATILQLLIKAYVPALDKALGIFIPLIAVNCIIFSRAESFAFRNPPLPSLVDGLGMGLGFTMAITLLAMIRELIGAGTVFGLRIMPATYEPMAIITQPPGGFFVLGIMLAVAGALTAKKEKSKAA